MNGAAVLVTASHLPPVIHYQPLSAVPGLDSLHHISLTSLALTDLFFLKVVILLTVLLTHRTHLLPVAAHKSASKYEDTTCKVSQDSKLHWWLLSLCSPSSLIHPLHCAVCN